MAKFTRGEFIGLSTAAVVGLSAGCRPGGAGDAASQAGAGSAAEDLGLAGTSHTTAGGEPDLMVVNARVYTSQGSDARRGARAPQFPRVR